MQIQEEKGMKGRVGGQEGPRLRNQTCLDSNFHSSTTTYVTSSVTLCQLFALICKTDSNTYLIQWPWRSIEIMQLRFIRPLLSTETEWYLHPSFKCKDSADIHSDKCEGGHGIQGSRYRRGGSQNALTSIFLALGGFLLCHSSKALQPLTKNVR